MKIILKNTSLAFMSVKAFKSDNAQLNKYIKFCSFNSEDGFKMEHDNYWTVSLRVESRTAVTLVLEDGHVAGQRQALLFRRMIDSGAGFVNPINERIKGFNRQDWFNAYFKFDWDAFFDDFDNNRIEYTQQSGYLGAVIGHDYNHTIISNCYN